ncbi:GNAT family N-acetyltransferase [Dyella sp. C9]|uniref:GNAT family N-acetyltransferase n=1 Tax=Dyella sp. C9 TaxID=2202154 RepID=UPI001E2D9692|nr:GNAT family N-acetyltransferase [Dyella sp. C9]
MPPPRQPASCAIVRSEPEVRALRDALARVAERAGAASGIVQHPDWLLYELEWRGDIMSPYLVVARDGQGELIGYAPMLAYRHHARVPLGGHHLPIYHGPVVRLLGEGVVAAPRHREAVERGVADALQGDRQQRVIRIQETTLPNALAGALARGAGGFHSVSANMLEQRNWSIAPAASLADYLGALGSKKRNDLARRLRNVYKKLGEDAHLRVFDMPDAMQEYTTLMNPLYARSWHAVDMPTDWTAPARLALFRRLAAEGRVIGHLLMQGERPVAYVHGYRMAGRYLLDDTGYDEAFAALGVGSSLVFQVVQDLLERFPGETIDFGYGDNQYKRVLANQQATCGSLYLVRGLVPRARFGVIGPVRQVYRWMHRKVRSEQASGNG